MGIALAGFAAALWLGLPQLLADEQRIAAMILQEGSLAIAWLAALGAAFTAAGGPRQLIAFAFGFALGEWEGALIATLATMGGASLCYLISRWTLQAFLSRRFPRQMDAFNAFLNQGAWQKIMAIRLAPVGSNLLTNALAGATRTRFYPFLIGSALGYLPQTLAFSFAGAGFGISGTGRAWIGVGLFALAALLSVRLRPAAAGALPRGAPS